MRSEPVLLVHGWGGSFARTWQDPGIVALLEDAGREVVGVDLLGHGTAPKPHDPKAYADLTERVLDAMAPFPVVDAIGFSLGAMTLLAIASRHPERFGRVVVAGVGANLFRDDPEERQRIIDAVEGHGPPDDRTAGLFAQYAEQPGNDAVALAACLRAPRARLSVDALAAVQVPVLVVLGDHDFAGPADPLVAALPDARALVLRNTDHFATTESFQFIDAALGFVEAEPA